MKKFFITLSLILGLAAILFAADFEYNLNFDRRDLNKTFAQTVEEVAAGPKILVLNYHQVQNSFSPLAVILLKTAMFQLRPTNLQKVLKAK